MTDLKSPIFIRLDLTLKLSLFDHSFFSLADEYRNSIIEMLSVSIKVSRNKKNYKITVCINHKLNSIRVCIPILNSVYIIQIQDYVLGKNGRSKGRT